MNLLGALILTIFATICFSQSSFAKEDGTLLSSILMTSSNSQEKLTRQGRSYYDQRYGIGRPYDRPEYDTSARCSRCLNDRDDGYDRPRDRFDDNNRRVEARPSYGSRYDRNNNDEDNDRRYNMDRNNEQMNGTDKGNDRDNRTSDNGRYGDRDRNRYDDRDRYGDRGRYGDRDRDRFGDKDRFGDRDRYGDRNGYSSRDRFGDRDSWPDYYDRFGRERPFERRYYADLYGRERRPLFDRYPEPYGNGFAGRYDVTGFDRQYYNNGYDRGNEYDIYGGYGPGFGRGAHDSFRPWDETYRGQAGWDAGGRGYYFASGRPDSASAAAWGRQEYARPESGWQRVDYSGGYRDQSQYQSSLGNPRDSWYQSSVGYPRVTGYQGSLGYPRDTGYQQDLGYGRVSGWHSVGERRLYRDQSGVNQLDNRGTFDQSRSNPGYIQSLDRNQPGKYGQPTGFGQTASYGQPNGFGQTASYGQPNSFGQTPSYGQPASYGQSGSYSQSGKYPSINYGQSSTFGQPNSYQSNTATNGFGQTSSTTPATSYLYQREDQHVTAKPTDSSTNPS